MSGELNHFRGNRTLAILLIAPAGLIVFIAMIVPLGYALVMSLFDYKVGAESQARFIFLGNYIQFFHDRLALSSLVTTIVFSVSALFLELTIGTLIAAMLTTIPRRLASILRTIYTMPLLVSPIIISLIWAYMYDPSYGLVYYLLGFVGLDQVFGGLAAKMDGAGPVRTFLQIMLPLIVRVLIVITIIRGMDAFRVFDIIFGLTKGGPADSTLSLSMYAFRQGFDYYATGYAVTISLFMMALLALVFTPLMRFFNDENAQARAVR